MLRVWGWVGVGDLSSAFVFKMAKVQILVCVPSMDILMDSLFCLFCLLALGNGKANVNLHVVAVFSFVGL